MLKGLLSPKWIFVALIICTLRCKLDHKMTEAISGTSRREYLELLRYVREIRTKLQGTEVVDDSPADGFNGQRTVELYPRTGIVYSDSIYAEVGIPNTMVIAFLGMNAPFPVPEVKINRLARMFGSQAQDPGFDLDYVMFDRGLPGIVTRKYDGHEYVLQTSAQVLVRQAAASSLRNPPEDPEVPVIMTPEKRASFEEATIRYYDKIFRYLSRLCRGNQELAQDLAQVCFERAFVHFAEFDGNVEPWLYRIATNAHLDEERRAALIRWNSLTKIPPPTLDAFFYRSKQTGQPHMEAIRAENHQSFWKAMDMLPPRHRSALTFALWGLSGEEGAKWLHTTPGSEKVLRFRARQELKDKLMEIDPEIALQ